MDPPTINVPSVPQISISKYKILCGIYARPTAQLRRWEQISREVKCTRLGAVTGTSNVSFASGILSPAQTPQVRQRPKARPGG